MPAYQELAGNPNPFGGDDAGPGFLWNELGQLSKFNHYREWDAQRSGRQVP